MKKLPLLFFCLSLVLGAFAQAVQEAEYVFPYDLEHPDLEISLPHELEEISALSLGPDSTTLLAVNDEEGMVFILDRETGALMGEKTFWKEGDFEGIEWADDRLWVIKSNGKLYEIRHFPTDSLCTCKHELPLSKSNDVEGLGYDPVQNRLLIAAKGQSYDSIRYFFSYMLGKCDTCFVSLFQISRGAVRNFISQMPSGEAKKQWEEQFGPEHEKFKFKPSAIAVHPKTGDLYILASAGKLLMVCDLNGNIKHLQKLDKEKHRQPEGLCFGPNGTLYISNEADGKKPRLFAFVMRE